VARRTQSDTVLPAMSSPYLNTKDAVAALVRSRCALQVVVLGANTRHLYVCMRTGVQSNAPCGGDGVEADRVGLAVLRVGARGDDTVRLALPVRHLSEVINDDMAGLARGLYGKTTLRLRRPVNNGASAGASPEPMVRPWCPPLVPTPGAHPASRSLRKVGWDKRGVVGAPGRRRCASSRSPCQCAAPCS
jgi:hypothetical protein